MDLPFDANDSGELDAGTLAFNVLVVDDEQVILDVFLRLLQNEGDLVVHVADAAEPALQLIDQQRIDLLITDKNLPGMGGIELVCAARRRRPSLEAIMITGYASAPSMLDALAAGASDYLTKPFDSIAVVRAKVRAALERRAERAKGRELARAMAKQASELLRRGRDAPDAAWKRLEDKFFQYERAIREGGQGRVFAVGGAQAAGELAAAGILLRRTSREDPTLGEADVVVIDTLCGGWRELAERLAGGAPDVLLLAHAGSDLADLLEALSLRIELVGFGGLHEKAVVERVQALLMRRTVQHAQRELGEAIASFGQSISVVDRTADLTPHEPNVRPLQNR